MHYILSDCLDDNGLTQIVEEPTRNTSTLDLIITNLPNKVQRVNTIPGISDHHAVFAEFSIEQVKLKQKP